jgi:glycerol kinase
VEKCIDGAVAEFEKAGHKRSQIVSVGLTNQRETTVVWDRTTGETLYKAIAWPDTRTQSLVRRLKSQPGADKLQDVCGLPLSTYPSSVKLLWMLENVPAVKKAYDAGNLMFGTVDAWLLYQLTGGKGKGVFVSDSTNASRTMFMDLHKLAYSEANISFFGLDPKKILLPKIVPGSDASAFGSLASGALQGVKIQGCLGDQSAALVGQCAFEPGLAKNTYGTGCFLLYNVGTKPVMSHHGLLATVGYQFGDSAPIYALEGSIAVAGSGVKFLMHNMGFAEASHKISSLAAEVDSSAGVVFVTAFSGLFAPYWIDDAQGTLFGITQHTNKAHIARATLEATCFQTRAILDAMEKDSGKPLAQLAVDGGMSNSDLCMQSQADICGIPVDRPAMRETTSLGAAIAAGLAAGVWKGTDELKHINREGRTMFKPKMAEKSREALYRKWKKAVEMCKGWVDEAEKDDKVVAEEAKI